VVDAFGNDDGRLADGLIDFQHRLRERLRKSPVGLTFDIALDDAPPVSPRVQLNALRVVQEAVSNALRHADAAHIAIAARWDPAAGAFTLTVDDDGCGFDVDAPRAGRGLRNLQRRALAIDARLVLARRSPGTHVALSWTP
jgi:signal transduction histidine kinase